MLLREARITKRVQKQLFACFVKDLTAVQTAYHFKKTASGKREKVAGIVDVSRPCATRYFRLWRGLIRQSLLRKYPRFSGEVEIDIGFFGGRAAKWTSAYVRRLAGLPAGRIVAKRKLIKKYEGRKQPVLGILNRGGDIFLLPLKSKSRAHLEGAVRMVVERGAVIYSDMEKGLSNLKLDGYTHHQINHSKGPVSAQGYHINGIESFWREARRSMSKNFRGVPRSTLDLHIKEREFRYNHRHDLAKALTRLLRPQASIHPVR